MQKSRLAIFAFYALNYEFFFVFYIKRRINVMAKTLIPRKTDLSKNISIEIYALLVSRQAHV